MRRCQHSRAASASLRLSSVRCVPERCCLWWMTCPTRNHNRWTLYTVTVCVWKGGVTVGACSCGVPGCEAVDHFVKLGTTRNQPVNEMTYIVNPTITKSVHKPAAEKNGHHCFNRQKRVTLQPTQKVENHLNFNILSTHEALQDILQRCLRLQDQRPSAGPADICI